MLGLMVSDLLYLAHVHLDNNLPKTYKNLDFVCLQHAATMEGLLKRSSYENRGFVLTRAFFAGSQRTGPSIYIICLFTISWDKIDE